MKSIDYSVVIRTVGKASEKYNKLLESIRKLNPQPKEVIVVLPIGYSLPQQRLGWERFVFSEKGMVKQRLYGMNTCNSSFALFCDDDVEFKPDFVEKLYNALQKSDCAFVAGPLYDFLPRRGLHTLIDMLSGSASPTVFHKSNYCTVLNTSGYSFNRNLKDNKLYYSQSLPWTCFFANTQKMRMVGMEDELLWLDKHDYGAMDDLTMFYKAYLLGQKTCVVPTATYIHNDARTSSRGKSDIVTYALIFNRIVFWHRFLYNKKKSVFSKSWSAFCIRYNLVARLLFCKIKDLKSKNHTKTYIYAKKGYNDAFRYIKGKEYKELPPF